MKTVFYYRWSEKYDCIRLICEKDGKEWLGIDLYPDSGFKSAGLAYQGTWLQPFMPKWSHLLARDEFGNSILFPTPNRVRNHTFTFQGQQVEMIKNGIPRSQHGLALDTRWQLKRLECGENYVLATAEFCIQKDDENYQAFPWKCRLTVTYRLTENALTFSYQVKNQSPRPMPFGIGLHPWFLLPKEPDQVLLCMPAEECFETTQDLLPTGKLIHVRQNKAYDLNDFRQIRELDLDTVFLTKAQDVYLRYDHRGYQIRIHATEEFENSVVFTAFSRGMNKEGYAAFCVETQSCCTDAINLHENGYEKSGLLVLSPDAEKSGKITYFLEACEKGEQG
ncbi:MAG: aldose 1-epimerase [Catenibacillus sp.]